jgi:hypothetical protein
MLDHQVESLTNEQIRSACLAMLSVARLQGLHDAEVALIAQFWAAAPTLGAFDPAVTAEFDATQFTVESEKILLIDLCLACAFADGSYSPAEQKQLAKIANTLSVSPETLAERTDTVRLAFLGSLAHLPDSQSVAALSTTLE